MIRVLIALAAASTAAADDWPQFRGPAGDGHYAGKKPVPLDYGPETNVVWKKAVPGHGWSSPIIWKGKIYLTTAVPTSDGDNPDYSLRALCLDAKTGDLDWNVEVFVEEAKSAPPPHKKNSHASPTPITDGERLYVHFGHMGTAALSLDGQKILWTKTKLYEKPQHGNGGSPILVDGNLILCCDGNDKQFVVALDAKTGDRKWLTPRDSGAKLNFSFATPHLIDDGKTRQIIAPASDITAAYDPKTGEEIWRIKYVGWSLIQRPVVGHGLVFASTGYMKPTLHAVEYDGTGDVTASKIKWSTKLNVSNTPSFLLVGDELYMVSDNGTVSCLDAKSGKAHYSERLKGAYSASPFYADGRIYLTSEEGKGTVLKAGPAFDKLVETDMKEPTFASFAAADGALRPHQDATLSVRDEEIVSRRERRDPRHCGMPRPAGERPASRRSRFLASRR